MNLTAVDLIGISGAVLVLLAFLQNNRGRWTAETVWYDVLNAVGSGLLLIFALVDREYPVCDHQRGVDSIFGLGSDQEI